MRVLITGSRNWTDASLILDTILRSIPHDVPLEEVTLVHGGCPSGADALASGLCREYQMTEEVHRADWGRDGKAGGPRRNQFMVDTRPDLVLAFPLGGSRGTRDCIRRAQVARLPMIVTEGEVNLGKEVPVPRTGL